MKTPCRSTAGTILLLLLLCGNLPTLGYGQTVSVHSITAPVNTLSYGDIDFVNSTTPKWLFTINIDVRPPDTVTTVMTIYLDISLANGEFYGDATTLVTRPFEIKSSRSITNLDIGKGKPIRDASFDFRQDARRRIEDIALSSGSVPAGRYHFRVKVEVSGYPDGMDEFTIIISNPSYVELIAPIDRDPFVNEFPLFQWRGDAPKWSIAVYQLPPGHRSLEDAITGVPHLPPTTVNGSSYLYPISGRSVRPLEPGKTYVWFVQGLVAAAGGTNLTFKSELRSFTVASGELSLSELLEQLEQALGPKYRGLFDQIRSDGLTPTSSIRLNGSPISITDLLRFLNDIRSNPEAVTAVLE
jgi:hypothetical protein